MRAVQKYLYQAHSSNSNNNNNDDKKYNNNNNNNIDKNAQQPTIVAPNNTAVPAHTYTYIQ